MPAHMIVNDAVDLASANSGWGIPGVAALGMIYDNESALWVRDRAHSGEISMLASAARTATTTASSTTNRNYRGAIFSLGVTTAGTGNLKLAVAAQFSFSAQDPRLGKAQTTGITAAGTYAYVVAPGFIASQDAAEAAAGFIVGGSSMTLPRTFYAVVTPSDASSWTYQLDVMYLR